MFADMNLVMIAEIGRLRFQQTNFWAIGLPTSRPISLASVVGVHHDSARLDVCFPPSLRPSKSSTSPPHSEMSPL